MMSQERLEAIVINAITDGKNAAKIAAETGVPIVRVQKVVHQVNGRDPAQANRDTRHKQRQVNRQLFGTTAAAQRQIGPNRSRGRKTG